MVPVAVQAVWTGGGADYRTTWCVFPRYSAIGFDLILYAAPDDPNAEPEASAKQFEFEEEAISA